MFCGIIKALRLRVWGSGCRIWRGLRARSTMSQCYGQFCLQLNHGACVHNSQRKCCSACIYNCECCVLIDVHDRCFCCCGQYHHRCSCFTVLPCSWVPELYRELSLDYKKLHLVGFRKPMCALNGVRSIYTTAFSDKTPWSPSAEPKIQSHARCIARCCSL